MDYSLLAVRDINHKYIVVGNEAYNGDIELLDFLTCLFYPGREKVLEKLGKYVDFTEHTQLRKEMHDMSGLGQSILEQGLELGIGLVLKNMVKKGNTCEEIAELTNLPLKQVEKIAPEIL